MRDWDDAPLALVENDADLTELLEATAAAPVVVPPFPRPTRRPTAPRELDPAEGWAIFADAPRPAQPERTPRRARTTITEAELAELLEAAAYKTDDHPRWPKGTPGGKGGQWMKVGELFTSGGKTWQISAIVKGRVYANDASAKYDKVETKAFDTAPGSDVATTVPGIQYTAPVVPKGGKHYPASNVPIVDPYVDSATHDPSIPVPEHSGISDEEWARFGKLDQEHYTELTARFGKHKPGAAKTHVDQAYAAYQAKVQQLVKKAYQNQYGSSSGFSLSMAAGSSHHAIPDTPEYAKLREEALALQGEHKAAVQWDLYNRARSPDVLSVHKSTSWSADQWHKHAISGSSPAFSGLSQSWNYRRHFFGKDGIVTPLAIRHVLMSSASAQPVPGETHFSSEIEISVPDQLKLDERTLAISSTGGPHKLTDSQIAWLEGMTNEPVGGQVLEQLRDAIKNGTYLPPPPKPASVVMDGAGGQTWVDPPEGAAKPDFGAKVPPVSQSAINAAALDKSLPWAHTDDDGVPKAVTGEEAGFKPGQYFMGLKGTLYWIGPDPGAPSNLRIHKIVDGAFNGENFAYDPTMPGFYLDETHAPPPLDKDKDAVPDFDPTKWVKGTESKFLDQFDTGEKFKLNGTVYEVTGDKPGGGKAIVDLESGLTGKINGDFKTTALVAFDGALPGGSPLAAPTFTEGQLVRTDHYVGVVTSVGEPDPDTGELIVNVTRLGGEGGGPHFAGDLTPMPVQAATVGTTFAMRRPEDQPGSPKVKATVTKILADGSVQVNLKPGVVKLAPDEWSAYAQDAYDPSAHSIGTKTKLRDLKPSDRFHGSSGQNTHRPYEVVWQEKPKSGGAKTHVRNLDTGEVTVMSAHKSYPTLDANAVDEAPLGADKATPDHAVISGPGNVGAAWDPSAYQMGAEEQNVHKLPVGTFVSNKSGTGVLQVTSQEDEHTVLTVVAGNTGEGVMGVGESLKVWKPEDEADVIAVLKVYEPKLAPSMQSAVDAAMDALASPDGEPLESAKFDAGNYIEAGAKMKIGQMRPGTVFKTEGKGGAKYYQLSDDGSHTTNLQTGKVYETKGHFKATPLKDADDVPAPEGADEAKPLALQVVSVSAELAAQEVNDTYVLDSGAKVHRVPAGWRVEAPDGTMDPTVYHSVATAAHAALTFAAPVPGHDEPGPSVSAPDPADVKPGKSTLGALKPGDLYHQDGVDVVGQVVKNDASGLWVKAAGAGDVVGIEVQPQYHDTEVNLVTNAAGNPHTISPLGTNAKGQKLGDLPVGSVFSPAHNGAQFKITAKHDEDTVSAQAVTGPNEGEQLPFGVNVVPDDLHSVPAAQAQVGQKVTAVPANNLSPSLQWAGSKTGFVKKVRPKDGAVLITGSTMWHKPENVTIHDEQLPPIKAGDKVTNEAGQTGVVVAWDEEWNGEPALAVDTTGDMDVVLWSPQSIVGIDVTTDDVQGVPLASKANVPTPYEQLAKGDVTPLQNLKAGDQFDLDGYLHTVVEQLPEDALPEDGYATIAAVVPGGAAGMPFNSGLHPGHLVKLHAKSEDVVPVAHPPVKADPTDLPDAVGDGGMVPYTVPGGGPLVFSQIGSMPQGAVFEDAGGQVWKVKVAGANPVIAAGSQHYQVDPGLRGKDLMQAAAPPPDMIDTSGPVGGGFDAEPAEVAAAQADVAPNIELWPVAQLAFSPGDFVVPSMGEGAGEVHEVDAVQFDGTLTLKNVATGQQRIMGVQHVPYSASPGAFVPPSPPDVDLTEPGGTAAPPTLYTEPTTLGALPAGTKFALAPGSSKTYVASVDNGPMYDDPDDPSTSFGATFETPVYVEPEAQPSPVNAPDPPSEPKDPGTLPPVEGPDDFAPAADVPPFTGNPSPDVLQAFTSRKGPGGIYSYPKLHETQIGQMFTDKSGVDYQVIDQGAGYVVYRNVATNEQHLGQSSQRVKLTALPPDPGPQLKPVVVDLTAKYGSLENVPKTSLAGFSSTFGADGKTKNPRVGHLKYGDVAYDEEGQLIVFLGSWLDRALVLVDNEPRLAPAGARVTLKP